MIDKNKISFTEQEDNEAIRFKASMTISAEQIISKELLYNIHDVKDIIKEQLCQLIYRQVYSDLIEITEEVLNTAVRLNHMTNYQYSASDYRQAEKSQSEIQGLLNTLDFKLRVAKGCK